MPLQKQEKYWGIAKWGANVMFVLATISLLSPTTASHAVTPWLLYLIGNIVWCADSYRHRDWPWVNISAFFIVWDTLILVHRITGGAVLEFTQPLITILEKLP